MPKHKCSIFIILILDNSKRAISIHSTWKEFMLLKQPLCQLWQWRKQDKRSINWDKIVRYWAKSVELSSGCWSVGTAICVFAPLSNRRWIESRTHVVCPDLSKFRNFGKILNAFSNFPGVYLEFGKMLNLLWQILHDFCQFSLLQVSKYYKNWPSGHTDSHLP